METPIKIARVSKPITKLSTKVQARVTTSPLRPIGSKKNASIQDIYGKFFRNVLYLQMVVYLHTFQPSTRCRYPTSTLRGLPYDLIELRFVRVVISEHPPSQEMESWKWMRLRKEAKSQYTNIYQLFPSTPPIKIPLSFPHGGRITNFHTSNKRLRRQSKGGIPKIYARPTW